MKFNSILINHMKHRKFINSDVFNDSGANTPVGVGAVTGMLYH